MNLNEQLKEQGALKISTQDYIVYNRDWLFEHLESEYKLLKESRKFVRQMPKSEVAEDEV